jgi:hypothetical protein
VTQGRVWIVAGACLDIVGAVMVATSLAQGGFRLVAGIGLVIVGSLLIARGVAFSAATDEGHETRRRGKPEISKWRPEAELRGPTPRTVRLSAAGQRMAFGWGLLIVVAGTAAFLFSQQAGPDSAILDQEGARTTGQVHDKTTREESGGTNYYIYYNFRDERGNGVRSSARVSESTYAAINVNDPIEIVYLPEDPLIHRAEGISEVRAKPSVVILAFIFLGLPLAMAELIRRRHRDLISRGTPVAGVVSNVRQRGAAQVLSASYTVDGRQHSLRGTLRRSSLREGDLVTVLYLSEHPDASVLYATSFYQAV